MEQQELISDDNTYIGKIVHYWDTRGLPKKKINIILKDGITMVAYIPVSVLPTPGQAEEGVFYITPDDVIHYIRGGVWHSMKPDGEDNVIEIIKTADGTELPVDPNDKSVTLPEDFNTTYTFEDILVNSKAVGWRVRDNDTGTVVYTHTDFDTKSDGVYYCSQTLDPYAGTTNTVPVSKVPSEAWNKAVLGETLFYDNQGTVAVVVEQDPPYYRAKTITSALVKTGYTHQVSILLNPEVLGETTFQTTDISGYAILPFDTRCLVVQKTLFYDIKGTVAELWSFAGNTIKTHTITNTKDWQSDGTYKSDVELNTTINGTTTIDVSRIPEITDTSRLVVKETLFYDNNGTVARLTAVSGSQLTVQTITTFNKPSKVYYTGEWLSSELHQTTEVARTKIFDLETKSSNPTATELKPGETFISNDEGTLGVVVGYANNTATIETIATNNTPYIAKLEDVLSDTVGDTKAIDALDLKDWHGRIIDETNVAIDKTLVVDVTRSCIGLVTAFGSGTATITTIYSSDAPYVFETTAHSLPALGESFTDLNLTSWRTDTTSIDGSQYLEEWNMIVGKTMIINRLEGKIAVITGVNKAAGHFTVKTVFESKSGEVLNLNDGLSLEPTIHWYGNYNITDLVRDTALTLDDLDTIVPYQTMVWDRNGRVGVVQEIVNATTGLLKIETITTELWRPIILSYDGILPTGMGAYKQIPKTDITPTFNPYHYRSAYYQRTLLVADKVGTLGYVSTELENHLNVYTISVSGTVLAEYKEADNVWFDGDSWFTADTTVLPYKFGTNTRLTDAELALHIVCRDHQGTWAELNAITGTSPNRTMTWKTIIPVAPRLLGTEDINHTINWSVNLTASEIYFSDVGSGGHPSDKELSTYLQPGKTTIIDEQGRIGIYTGRNTGANPTEYHFKTILIPNGGGKYYVAKSTAPNPKIIFDITPNSEQSISNNTILDPITSSSIDMSLLRGGEVIYDEFGTQAYWVGLDPLDNTKSIIRTAYSDDRNFIYFSPVDDTIHLDTKVGNTSTVPYSELVYLEDVSTVVPVQALREKYIFVLDRYTGTIGLYIGENASDSTKADILTVSSGSDVAGKYYVLRNFELPLHVGETTIVNNNIIYDQAANTVADLTTFQGGEIVYDDEGTLGYWAGFDPTDNTKSKIVTGHRKCFNFFFYKPADTTNHLNPVVGQRSTISYGDIRYMANEFPANVNRLVLGESFIIDYYTGTVGLYVGANMPDDEAEVKTIIGSGANGKYYLLQDTETTPPEIFSRETSAITTVSNSHIIDPITGNPIDIALFTGGEIVYDINGTMAYWLGLDTSDNTKSRFKTAHNINYNFVYYKPANSSQHLDYRPRSNTTIPYSELVYINASANTVARREMLKAGYTIVVDFYTGTTGLYTGGTADANVMTLSSSNDLAGKYYVAQATGADPRVVFGRTPLTLNSVSNSQILNPNSMNPVDLSKFVGGELVYDIYGTVAQWLQIDPSDNTKSILQTIYNSDFGFVYFKDNDPSVHLTAVVGAVDEIPKANLVTLTTPNVSVETQTLVAFHTMVYDYYTGTKGLYIGDTAGGDAQIRIVSIAGGDRITEQEIYNIWYGEESS